MASPTHRVPTNLPRRDASAVRDFPSGCGIVNAVPKPNLSPLSPVESTAADAAASSTPIPFNTPKESSPVEESEKDTDFDTKKRPPSACAVRSFPPARGPAAALVVSGNEAGDVVGMKDETNELSGDARKNGTKGVRDNADSTDKKKRIVMDVSSNPNLSSLSPVESNTTSTSTPMTTTISSNTPKDPTPGEGSENDADFETKKKKINVQLFARTPSPLGAVRDFPSACGPAAAALLLPGNEVEGIKAEIKEISGDAKKHSTKGVRDNADSADKNTRIVVYASKPSSPHLSPIESNTADAAASSTPTRKKGASLGAKKKIDMQLSANSRRPPRVGTVRDFPSARKPATAAAASVVPSNQAGDVKGMKDEAKEFSGKARKHSTKIVPYIAESADLRTRTVVQALMAAENCPWRRGKAAGDVKGVKDEPKEVSGNGPRKHSAKGVRDNADSSDNRTRVVVHALMAAENCPWRRGKGKAAGSPAAKS